VSAECSGHKTGAQASRLQASNGYTCAYGGYLAYPGTVTSRQGDYLSLAWRQHKHCSYRDKWQPTLALELSNHCLTERHWHKALLVRAGWKCHSIFRARETVIDLLQQGHHSLRGLEKSLLFGIGGWLPGFGYGLSDFCPFR
jgi:hypothetical protein